MTADVAVYLGAFAIAALIYLAVLGYHEGRD